jgi:hypothetical protein
MESSESFPETHNLPPALKPGYEIGEPHKPIPLYEGDLEIEHQGNLTQGSGTVYLKWFPYPQIQFESSGHQLLGANVEKASLKVPETDGLVEALIAVKQGFNQTTGETKEVLGNVREPIVKGSGQDLTYIKFHLTNFENFNGSSRAVIEDESGERIRDSGIFEAEGWKVTVDPYKTSEQINSQTSSIKILKSQGGYAVTHVGKLERLDGKTFTANEPCTRSFLEALSYFLSFVRGLRIEPLLLIGYDASNQRIWEEWALSNSDPWRKDLFTWAWGLRAEDIASAFRGFLSWWHSWGESAKIVIHWYIASNAQAGAVEGSIVFEQAAFELLSRIFLVENKRILSLEGFDKLPAADRLKLLLSQCRIPLEVPSSLTNLTSFSEKENYDDGAQILTEIRNFIAHSGKKTKRDRFLRQPKRELVRFEAYTLGLWYLELILLSLFDYQGHYYNRLRPGNIGDLEPVPWLS